MADLMVSPAHSLRGTLTLPGDKSISHRCFLLGAVAQGPTRITRFLESEDVGRSRRAVELLGIPIRQDGQALILEGRGWDGLREPRTPLDMGNSGTTTRLLLGILAGCPFPASLIGDASLSARPMRRVTEPLVRMGAAIEGPHGPDRLPLTIRGGRIQGIRYEMPVASAQVKSALLLAGLRADAPTTVVEPLLTRYHTERMLRWMGARVES